MASGAAQRRARRERGEAPAPRRRSPNEKRSGSKPPPKYRMPTMMIDSEGGNDEHGRHHCMVLCAADEHGAEHVLRTGAPLTSAEILAWLVRLPRDRLIIGYSLGYDWSMWLRDLPADTRRAMTSAGGWVEWEGYRLQMLGNRVTVTRPDPRCKWSVDEGKRRHVPGHTCRSVIVHDVVKFYQQSFLGAIGHSKGGWGVVTEAELAVIEEGKEGRASFTTAYACSDAAVAYSLAECRVGARLVEALKVAVEDAIGQPLQQFFGAGSIAKMLLKRNGVDAHLGEGGWPPGTPAAVRKGVMHAYFGGRFEACMFGPVSGLPVVACASPECRGRVYRHDDCPYCVCDMRAPSEVSGPSAYNKHGSGISLLRVQQQFGVAGNAPGSDRRVSLGVHGRGASRGCPACAKPWAPTGACGCTGGEAGPSEGTVSLRPGVPGACEGPVTCSARIDEYDITSAYPSTMAALPCLTHAAWVHSRGYVPPAEGMYAQLHRVTWDLPADTRWGPFPWRMKDGSIVCPRRGSGWYWGREVAAAQRLHPEGVRILDTWTLVKGCQCRPFDWVADMYQWRMARGNKNDGPGIVAKLGLNSLYGAAAQSVGSPVWQSFVWAGIITSDTRAKLLDAIALAPDDVFMVATDAVFSRAPLDGLESPGLGGWEATGYGEAFVVAPGVAMLDGKLKTRGMSRKEFVGVQDAIRADWERVGPWARASTPVTRFIGLRSGLVRPAVYCQWVESERTVRVGSGPKREHPGTGGIIPWETPYRTLAARGPGGMSKVYTPKNEVGAVWQAAQAESAEQPD